mgnify:CR=1 FL=1
MNVRLDVANRNFVWIMINVTKIVAVIKIVPNISVVAIISVLTRSFVKMMIITKEKFVKWKNIENHQLNLIIKRFVKKKKTI